MNILMVGGGSGGHVTPLRAVAKQLKVLDEQAQITVITDRKFSQQARSIFSDIPAVKMKVIFAGKIRRYNGKSFLWHILHIPTLLLNVRDLLFLGLGFLQSFWHLIIHRPTVIFSKGGFVAVPVGIVGALLRIPIVIHDSDTHPGLTSRILSKRATAIATGMPTKYYPYAPEKMKYTGIPVEEVFKPVEEAEKKRIKKELGLDDSKPLLLVVGGGTGAKKLNEAVEAEGEWLINNSWSITQITGPGKAEPAMQIRAKLPQQAQAQWIIHEFTDITRHILACDVALVRTGATTMQELANARKGVITVPSPYLSGGHQLKNATAFEEKKSVIVLHESALTENPHLLSETVVRVQTDKDLLKTLAENLHKTFAKPDAAKELARLVYHSASTNK